MAARFALYTGDYDNCSRICKKLLSHGGTPSTPIELEAVALEFLSGIVRIHQNSSPEYVAVDLRPHLTSMDTLMKGQSDASSDLDLLMIWSRSRQMLGRNSDAINVLNKVLSYSYLLS